MENFNVLPIYCPDPSCHFHGFLDTNEIKSLLLGTVNATKYSSSSRLSFDSNNNNNKIDDIDVNVIGGQRLSSSSLSLLSPTNNVKSESSVRKLAAAENLSYYKKYLRISENIGKNRNYFYEWKQKIGFLIRVFDVFWFFFKEVIRDPYRTYCPVPTCENVCRIERSAIQTASSNGDASSTFEFEPVKVTCNKCKAEFCSNCFRIIQSSSSPSECKCRLNGGKKPRATVTSTSMMSMMMKSTATTKPVDAALVAADNSSDLPNMSTSLLFNFENIKQCPKCGTLFERADGCAQIMCKCCKHTFCFYCLKSLEVPN